MIYLALMFGYWLGVMSVKYQNKKKQKHPLEGKYTYYVTGGEYFKEEK